MSSGKLLHVANIEILTREVRDSTIRVLVIGGSGFIGSAICEALFARGFTFLNADVSESETSYPFVKLDLLDMEYTFRVIDSFQPETIINLASRTDDQGKSIFDYYINYVGVANLLKAIKRTKKEIRLFHFSTQYVVGPEQLTKSRGGYSPYTTYGESKAIGEILIRSTEDVSWTILRPTAVWGPRHPSFPEGLWRLMEKGLFVQPSITVMRSYIYVGTLVQKLLDLMSLDNSKTRHEIFYLGNRPSNPALLMDEFCMALNGKKPLRLPLWIFKIGALICDLVARFGIQLPLSRLRVEIMSTDYLVDTTQTEELIGEIEEDVKKCVEETMTWYTEVYQRKARSTVT